MIIDNEGSYRYLVIDDENTIRGWKAGWDLFDLKGSPKIDLEVKEMPIRFQDNTAMALDYNLWPDTKDYDQNNPGIMDIVADLDRRCYDSNIEKAFWVNVTRVPICVSYLAGCAKVRPHRILELGTGGDSAHSTGMFHYWLNQGAIMSPLLVSVDRHPLSHAWLRYRNHKYWTFIQGDSITVMKRLINGWVEGLPTHYDMIFIDSSHTYPHTLKEIEQASYMTNAILLDDTTVEDVSKSLDEFLAKNRKWLRIDLAHGVTLIEAHDYIPTT